MKENCFKMRKYRFIMFLFVSVWESHVESFLFLLWLVFLIDFLIIGLEDDLSSSPAAEAPANDNGSDNQDYTSNDDSHKDAYCQFNFIWNWNWWDWVRSCVPIDGQMPWLIVSHQVLGTAIEGLDGRKHVAKFLSFSCRVGVNLHCSGCRSSSNDQVGTGTGCNLWRGVQGS